MRRWFVLLTAALLAPATADAQKAAPEIRFEIVDGDGVALPAAEARVFNQSENFSAKSDGNGQAKLAVPNGSYQLEVLYRGEVLLGDRLQADEDKTLQFKLPIYKFRVQVSAINGDLMDGARASYVDSSGKAVEVAVQNGKIEGVAREGKVSVQMLWNAQTVPVATLQLPGKRSEIVELEVVNLDAQLVQKDTGLGFGPALIAAASSGNEFPAGAWSDPQGKVSLAVFPGATRVRAQWFGTEAVVDAKAPGTVKIPLALASKTIAGPDEGPRVPYLAQLRQPGFQVWANGDPVNGIRLPLPVGKYDVTIFDDRRQPLFRGIATVTADQARAEVSWQKTSGGTGADLADRRLEWPRGIWATAPSVAVQEGSEWRPVLISDNGSLGLLPPGMHLRVPDHALGKIYVTEGANVPVQLGVIEVNLGKPERVKIISADQAELTVVENCGSIRCRIALPPGKYLVYVPSAQLLKEPIAVANGQVAFIHAKPQ